MKWNFFYGSKYGFVILIFDHHAITLKVKKNVPKKLPNLLLKIHDYYFLNTKMNFENKIIIQHPSVEPKKILQYSFMFKACFKG